MFAEAPVNEFARDVRTGLTHSGQKFLPCRYLYDQIGSALFDAITFLPEYGLTRADARLIDAHADELRDLMPVNLVVAELGSGSGAKTRTILERLSPRGLAGYYPIDVSTAALARCAQELSPICPVVPLEMSYLDGLREVSARRAAGEGLLLLFLGSTIGNFEPDEAVDFLYAVRQILSPGDGLLLGTDLVKPAKQLLDAYDDPTGVTAAFNLNILGRINRELEADFDLRQFAHVLRYHEEAQRLEMHLRSRAYQIVSVRKADLIVDFAPEETICTEAIHKYHASQVKTMAEVSGFDLTRQWIDEEWGFAENLLTV
jgi:L-histidine N-alpha-methyltransferase